MPNDLDPVIDGIRTAHAAVVAKFHDPDFDLHDYITSMLADLDSETKVRLLVIVAKSAIDNFAEHLRAMRDAGIGDPAPVLEQIGMRLAHLPEGDDDANR